MISNCKSSKCRVCTKSHLLHRYELRAQQSPSSAYTGHVLSTDQVILATGSVQVKDPFGQFMGRVLLDSGSQIHFMSKSLAQQLRLQRERSTLSVITVGESTTSIKHKVSAYVQSRFSTDF